MLYTISFILAQIDVEVSFFFRFHVRKNAFSFLNHISNPFKHDKVEAGGRAGIALIHAGW